MEKRPLSIFKKYKKRRYVKKTLLLKYNYNIHDKVTSVS